MRWNHAKHRLINVCRVARGPRPLAGCSTKATKNRIGRAVLSITNVAFRAHGPKGEGVVTEQMLPARLRVAGGSSEADDAFEAGTAAATEAITRLERRAPAMIVVYASVRYDLPQLLASIRAATVDAPVVGQTSTGQFRGPRLLGPGRGVAVLAMTAGRYRFGLACVEKLSDGAADNADTYQELRCRATRDPLAGLANRDLAVQHLDQSLTTGHGLFTGLLFCDLDGFKSVNDRLGHDAGHELPQQVATRFQTGLRPGDLIARFGGDEFVAVLGEIATLDDVVDVGRRLVKALNEPFDVGEERVAVSASIGGALGARSQTTAVEMLRNADTAMYTAKSRGAGGVEVFDGTTSNRSLH